MNDIQYINQIKKGVTVTYGEDNTRYKVQDDGKGYLHIVVKEKGKRRKIGIDKLCLFDAGSLQDYIFNRWFEYYDSFEEYHSFAISELSWLN